MKMFIIIRKICKIAIVFDGTFGFNTNAPPEYKKENFEHSIQITGFRMFLGSKHYDCSNKIIYANYSGDSSKDLNNFSINVSEPVISRIVIRIDSSDKSRGRRFTSEKQENGENTLRTGLESEIWTGMEAYLDPFPDPKNTEKLYTFPYNSPSQPNFRRQSKNSQSNSLTFNQNNKSVIQILDVESENIETLSSFSSSSESQSIGNISEMSSLVLSNMKTGRLSRDTSFIQNIWSSTTKGKNKRTEEISRPTHETFTINDNKELKIPHKSFNNLNGIFFQNRRQIYQDFNSISLQSFSDEKLGAITESSWKMSGGNSSCCVRVHDSLKYQELDYVSKILTEYGSDTHPTESAEVSQPSIPLKGMIVKAIATTRLPKKATINPVDIKIVDHMPVKKIFRERCFQNKCSQSSTERAPYKSKSIVFCPSLQDIPGNFNDTLINLCDDCYQKTKKTLSDMDLNCVQESPIMSDRSEILGKEYSTQSPENQSHEFKKENESSENKLPSHAPRKLNMEQLGKLLEIVNNHLLGLKHADEKFLKEAMQPLNEKWILVFSNKNAMLKDVRSCLKYIQDFSDQLLKTMMFSTDREGNNAFHFACGNERFDIAEELLNYECGYVLLTQKNKLGHSPLMICSVLQPRNEQDWRVVEKILDLGDVNEASSFSKQTPLMNAASRGCDQMVRLLLEAGADPNLQDSDGSTALMYAAVHGHEACVGLLLEHPKCNTRIKDYDQQTACSVALAAGHKEIALRIYLHSRKRCKDTKIKLVTNYLQKNNVQPLTISKTRINALSRSQSDPQ